MIQEFLTSIVARVTSSTASELSGGDRRGEQIGTINRGKIHSIERNEGPFGTFSEGPFGTFSELEQIVESYLAISNYVKKMLLGIDHDSSLVLRLCEEIDNSLLSPFLQRLIDVSFEIDNNNETYQEEYLPTSIPFILSRVMVFQPSLNGCHHLILLLEELGKESLYLASSLWNFFTTELLSTFNFHYRLLLLRLIQTLTHQLLIQIAQLILSKEQESLPLINPLSFIHKSTQLDDDGFTSRLSDSLIDLFEDNKTHHSNSNVLADRKLTGYIFDLLQDSIYILDPKYLIKQLFQEGTAKKICYILSTLELLNKSYASINQTHLFDDLKSALDELIQSFDPAYNKEIIWNRPLPSDVKVDYDLIRSFSVRIDNSIDCLLGILNQYFWTLILHQLQSLKNLNKPESHILTRNDVIFVWVNAIHNVLLLRDDRLWSYVFDCLDSINPGNKPALFPKIWKDAIDHVVESQSLNPVLYHLFDSNISICQEVRFNQIDPCEWYNSRLIIDQTLKLKLRLMIQNDKPESCLLNLVLNEINSVFKATLNLQIDMSNYTTLILKANWIVTKMKTPKTETQGLIGAAVSDVVPENNACFGTSTIETPTDFSPSSSIATFLFRPVSMTGTFTHQVSRPNGLSNGNHELELLMDFGPLPNGIQLLARVDEGLGPHMSQLSVSEDAITYDTEKDMQQSSISTQYINEFRPVVFAPRSAFFPWINACVSCSISISSPLVLNQISIERNNNNTLCSDNEVEREIQYFTLWQRCDQLTNITNQCISTPSGKINHNNHHTRHSVEESFWDNTIQQYNLVSYNRYSPVFIPIPSFSIPLQSIIFTPLSIYYCQQLYLMILFPIITMLRTCKQLLLQYKRKNLRLYNRNAFLNSSSSQLDSNMTRLLYIHSIHLFLHSLASYFQQDVIEGTDEDLRKRWIQCIDTVRRQCYIDDQLLGDQLQRILGICANMIDYCKEMMDGMILSWTWRSYNKEVSFLIEELRCIEMETGISGLNGRLLGFVRNHQAQPVEQVPGQHQSATDQPPPPIELTDQIRQLQKRLIQLSQKS